MNYIPFILFFVLFITGIVLLTFSVRATEGKMNTLGIVGLMMLVMISVVFLIAAGQLFSQKGKPLHDDSNPRDSVLKLFHELLADDEIYLVQWSVKKAPDNWIVGLKDRKGEELIYSFKELPPKSFIRKTNSAGEPLYFSWPPVDIATNPTNHR